MNARTARRVRIPDAPAHRETLSGAQAVLSHDMIATRAYQLFLEHGQTHGHDLEDWLQAERDLRGGAVTAQGKSLTPAH